MDVPNDSSFYVAMGHNLLAGNGFSIYPISWETPANVTYTRISHYPPGYPLLLAAMEFLGLDPRGHDLLVVNAVLLLTTLLLTGVMVYRLAGTVAWAWLAVLLVLTGSLVTTAHLQVMSEPLFIVLLMGGSGGLLVYMQTERRLALVLSAVFMGLMWLTRYAGVGIVMPAIALVALTGHRSLSMRFRHASVYALIACLPIGLWLVRNAFVASAMLGTHTLRSESLIENLHVLLRALTAGFNLRGTERVEDLILLAVLLVAVPPIVSAGQHWYRSIRAKHERPNWITLTRYAGSPKVVLSALIVSYCAFIFVCGAVSNADINERIFAPVYPLFVVLCVASTSHLIQGRYSPRSREISSLLMLTGLSLLTLFSQPLRMMVGALAVVIVGLALWSMWTRRKGLPQADLVHTAMLLVVCVFIYNHVNRWVYHGSNLLQLRRDVGARSEVIGWLKENAEGKVLYTNVWGTLYFHLDDDDARIKTIPPLVDDSVAHEFSERVAESSGYVVIVDLDYGHQYYPILQTLLMADDRFVMIQDLQDGQIYQAR